METKGYAERFQAIRLLQSGSPPKEGATVIDVGMRNGSLQEARRTAGVELTGGILAVEGPLLKGRSSYLLSGRYVDLTPLHRYFEDSGTVGIPKLGDIFGKLFVLAGDNLDLSLSGIFSYSKYDYALKVGGITDNLEFFSPKESSPKK